MYDILKVPNDGNPSDVRALDEVGLHRLENLCEVWAKIAEQSSRAANHYPGRQSSRTPLITFSAPPATHHSTRGPER